MFPRGYRRRKRAFRGVYGEVRYCVRGRCGQSLLSLMFSVCCITVFIHMLLSFEHKEILSAHVFGESINVSSVTVILTESRAVSAFSVPTRLVNVFKRRAWCTPSSFPVEVTAVFVLGATASKRDWHGNTPVSCVSCNAPNGGVDSSLSLWSVKVETPCVARVFALFNESATPNKHHASRTDAHAHTKRLFFMVRAALAAVQSTDHFVVMDDFLTPMRNDFMEKLLEPLQRNNGKVMAVQCTIVEAKNKKSGGYNAIRANSHVFEAKDEEDTMGNFTVLDGGALVRFAIMRTKKWLLPYILRRNNGFPADDARVVVPEVLDAVSPFCTFFHRKIADFMDGLSWDTVGVVSKGVKIPSASTAPDMLGWGLSVSLQQKFPSWEVWSSGAFAAVRAEKDSTMMREALVQAVYSAADDWGASWFDTLARLQARRTALARECDRENSGNGIPLPPLLLFWRDYSCRSCGLMLEMIGYLRPLGARYSVFLSGQHTGAFMTSVGAEEAALRLSIEKNINLAFGSVSDSPVWRKAYMQRRKIVIMHLRAHRYHQLYQELSGEADYFVGRSLSESSRIPSDWAHGMKHYANEVWATGDFFRSVYSRSDVPKEKIHTLPEAINTRWYDPKNCRPFPLPLSSSISSTNLPHLSREDVEKRYRFLSVFKWESRKGWDILLEAYWRAFGPSSPLHHNATLYLRVTWTKSYSFGVNDANIWERLTEWGRKRLPGFVTMQHFPHLVILKGSLYMSDIQLRNLYCTTNAFIIPTRGEGWGLPAIEAMAMELPVLITNWGGSTAFMNRNVTLMIPIDGLEEIPKGHSYRTYPGNKWAVPSVKGTADAMQYVVENPAHGRIVGRRGRRYVVKRFSEDAVADLFDNRIAAVYKTL